MLSVHVARTRGTGVIWIAPLFLFMAVSQTGSAVVLVANSEAQLISAINSDNGNGTDDTIVIDAVTITLSAAGLPLVTSNIAFVGQGAGQTIIDGDLW